MFTPTPVVTTDDTKMTVRLERNFASIFVLVMCTAMFAVGAVMLGGNLIALVSDDPSLSCSPVGLFAGVLFTAVGGYLTPVYAWRLFRRVPFAVLNRTGLWIRARKNYSWRWQDIGAMYVWQQPRSSTIFVSFDPWPSTQVNDMCERMKAKWFTGIGNPVPTAARALTVPISPGMRPRHTEIVNYVRQVAPNVRIEFL